MSSDLNHHDSDSRHKDDLDGSARYLEKIGDPLKYDSTLRESVRMRNNSSVQSENLDLASAAHEPKLFFVCGRCDMLVSEDDKICQFCGAEFLDDGEVQEVGEEQSEIISEEEGVDQLEVESEIDLPISESLRQKGKSPTRKVDVIEMLEEGRAKLGTEHLSGGTNHAFSYSAKLLRKVEAIVEEASEFGADAEEAKRLLLMAHQACNECNWNQAIYLAEEAKKSLTPSVENIVRGQISCLREAMVEMKRRGEVLCPMIVEIKTIQHALGESRIDDAIEMTRTLITATRKAQMELLNTSPQEKEERIDSSLFSGEGI